MSRSSDKGKPTKICGGKYEIEKKLGAGCFGEVHRAVDTTTQKQVAVKMEEIKSAAVPQLEHEADILRQMSVPVQPQGFAEMLHYGVENNYKCMVVELLGKSLEDKVQASQGKFSVDTTVLVADQVLRRIEYLHSKCFVHRDIKPENFMIGMNDKRHHIYLIDFGLSKRYYENGHCVVRTKLSLTGTARYASINAHRGCEQSRRDDLEAIGHMFMYFLRGSVPWSGLEAKSQQEKYRKICDKKVETPLETLCAGYPDAFMTYLRTAREMEFVQRPNYKALRKDFWTVRVAQELNDKMFPWLNDGKSTDDLVPLNYDAEDPRQPDDRVNPKAKKFFGCCGGGQTKD